MLARMSAPCRTPSLRGRNAEPPAERSPALEARHSEIRALLDDIRARRPTPDDIVRAVESASGGTLSRERLDRIVANILSLY
jgi:hypothetical protein